jgi:lipopolysaccharide export system protein LptA
VRLTGWIAVLCAIAVPLGSSGAQQEERRPCELVFETNPDRPSLFSRLPSGNANIFAGGGVRGICRGQDIVITADSAEYYGDQRILYLLGNVRYREPRARVDALKLTYWMFDERLLAEGSVVVTLPSGTVARGPIIEYLRAAPAVRQVARMDAPRRTITRIPQEDTTGTARIDTVTVEADRTVSLADSLVYTGGNVIVTRRDMRSVSDSAFMDRGKDIAMLIGNAKVDATGSRPFTLAGSRIDLFSREKQLERVLARVDASATSEDFLLTADTIDLRVSGEQLQRAFAWGPSRARATSPGRLMVSDSMDVHMPSQRLTEVRMIRAAYAEGEPDTTRITTTERDWLRGDTIVAHFDTTVLESASDSSPRLRELVARGSARSYYQIPSDKGTDRQPAINYVRGRQIVLTFRDDQIDDVTVKDSASGVYIEPGAASNAQAPARGAGNRGTSGGRRP